MSSTPEEQAAQIKEFLERGGKIDQIPQGKSGYVEGQSRSAWGAPRKRKPDVAPKPQKDL